MKFRKQNGEVVQKIRTENERLLLEIPENTEVYLIKLKGGKSNG